MIRVWLQVLRLMIAPANVEALPNGRLLWLEGAGHMPNLEAPKALDMALVELLERASEEGRRR